MHRSLHAILLFGCSSAALAQFGPQHFAFVSDVQYPWRLQFADLNGDGHADLISNENQDLYWWANDGTGTFGDRQSLISAFLSASARLYTVDVDMDGDIDLLCHSGWWANDGGGTFTFLNNINPYLQLAGVSDVDGDGDPDLVGRTGVLVDNVITTFFGTVLNDGNGNFTNGTAIVGTPASTISATFADFDADGDPDLVLGGDASLGGYYPNLGAGTFGARQAITDYAGTAAAQAADIEGDGDVDLVVSGGNADTRWFANDGNAGFAVADTINAGAPFADVDNDGDVDMIVGTGTTCDAKWYRNDGGGMAWSTLNVELFSGYNLAGTKYAFADVNEDGFMDMAICHGLGIIAWYPNNGDGTFGLRQRIGHELGGGSGMSVTDLDGDGDNDIAAAGFYGDWVTTYANNGDGTFAQQVVVMEHLDQVSTCNTADLDGDGYPELLTNKPEAAVLWNDGTGHFSAGTLPDNGTAPLPADLDGDLDPDLVGTGAWYRNDGSGEFTEQVDTSMNITGATAVKSGLLNADAVPDLVYFGTTVNVLLNDGNGAFNVLTTTPTAQLMVLDVADLDDDGDNDLVGISFNDVLYGYFNDGNGALTEQQLLVGSQGIPRHILTFDINGDGHPDVVWARSNGYDHKTYAALNNGDGTLGGIFIVDPSAESTASLAFADVNGDVVPDLVESRFHTVAWQENHFFDAYRLRGDVFKDFDQDGARDAGDAPQAFAPMRTDPAGVLNWTNSFGRFDMAVDSGVTYQLWPHLPAEFTVTSDPDTAVVQATANEPIVDSLLFGIGPTAGSQHTLFTENHSPFRCDSDRQIWLVVGNIGASIPTNITVSLELVSGLTQVTAVPEPDSIVGQVLYWSLDSLVWFSQQVFEVDVHTGPAGQVAEYIAVAQGNGFPLTSLNSVFTISCAIDPNDKLVLPAGEGVHHTVPIDQDWLDYTIRFQNTGTDTAFNVLLVDRLSADLDWQSMEVLGTSHPLTNIFIQEDGELNFRYDHINLPDSGADMAGSNGYVRFRMRPLPDLPNLTEIHNTAEIYFDFNAPVITNTTLTTLVDCEAFSSSITQLDVDLLQASAGESYQWFQDGLAIPGATSQELLVEVTGFYAVEVTNAYGCAPMSEEVQVVISGMHGPNALRMAVVPNPMSEVARVLFDRPMPSDALIQLMDVNGRIMRQLGGNGTRELIIARGTLASGIYTIRVSRNGDGTGGTVRLVLD